jgi:glycosyltransferase involved in cell wall biosynthesis
MKKRLAIVSSYNTACGNASYTHVLKCGLEEYFDVTIVAVDHRLLANAHPKMRPIAARHIAELAETLATFDYVNIQFEAGLYGFSAKSIASNVERLIRACKKNLLITLHHLHTPVYATPFLRQVAKNKFRVLKTLRENSYQRFNGYIYKRLFATLRKLSSDRNIQVIVHTPRDKQTVINFYDFKNVTDFPITFLSKEIRERRNANKEQIKHAFFQRYQLDESLVYIGIFGFLTVNKGHHVAVEMMKYLPPNYRLLIAGVQHPQGISRYDFSKMLASPREFLKNSDPYITSLNTIVKIVNRAIPNRVRFLGSLDDEEFLDAVSSVDFTVLPYFESGQNGSGNAALMLELGAKSVFSRCNAFIELRRYYSDCYEFADIANVQEMAQKILFWKSDYSTNISRALETYNLERNVQLHARLLEGSPA